jgi:hypothetical protein
VSRLDAVEQLHAELDWVRAHKLELGACNLTPSGEGRRPRLRFSREQIAQAMTRLAGDAPDPVKPRRGRARKRPPSAVELLPVGPSKNNHRRRSR